MQFGLYFLGGWLVLKGLLNIGDLFLFAAYYKMLSESLNKVSRMDADLRANQIHTDRLREGLQDLDKCTHDIPSSIKIKDIKSIRLDQVSYRYPNTGEYLLRNINAEINQGELIGVVGRSGSGKTTLVKLIP